jgi:hypothetical protein
MIKNKKAQSEYPIIFIYRFLIIILVIGAIVGLVWWRFSKPYDIRPMEASALAQKSISCLASTGMITPDNFNEKTISDCIEIDRENLFMNFTLKGQSPKDIFFATGNLDLEPYCSDKKPAGKYLPSCFNETYRVLNSSQMLTDLNIIIIIEKQEKNV